MERPYRFLSRIRFVDTDASQRIHYTAMFRHFEAAEQEFLRQLGCPYHAPGLEMVSFPRVHVECDFSAELGFDDLVEIALTVDRVGTSSYTLGFVVTKDGRGAARGKITVVCMDRGTQRPCLIPEKLSAALRTQL